MGDPFSRKETGGRWRTGRAEGGKLATRDGSGMDREGRS